MVDLKSLLSPKEENIEYYWALVIEPGWVQAGIWYITESQVQVFSVSPTSAWETDAELISSSDTVLSSCVQKLPGEAGEPSKTVFGVSSFWVDEGQIKRQYLDKIKAICSELSLQPVGFVVLPEAISHYMKSKEGSPLNAIVIAAAAQDLEISLFRLGNLVGNSLVARSVSTFDDVIEGLARFTTGEAFPSRIILYNGKEGELENVRQSLTDAAWDEKSEVKFLHTPKVETISPDEKILATALAGGSEIASVNKVVRIEDEEEEIEKPEIEEAVETAHPEDFGFSVGEDIAKKSDNLAKPTPDDEKASQSLQEVLERKEESEEPLVEKTQTQTAIPVQLPEKEGRAMHERSFATSFNGIKDNLAIFAKLFKRKAGDFPESEAKASGKRVFVLGIVIFVALVLAGGVFWWFYPKATVTVYVSPKTIEESVSILVDTDSNSVNFEDKIIPGSIVSKEVSGDKTKSTTGTKTVGERAKGEVVLYRSGIEISLDGGTKVIGPGGLEYTLDNDVTVASGSAGNPGKTNAQVSASDIGTQYNLASGETFKVDDYSTSDIEGKNDSDLSGGSSREINAVSEEDIKVLEEELSEELLDKAKSQIENTLTDEDYYIKESTSEEVLSRDFSNKVGDEAANLKLSLAMKSTALIVNKTNLLDLSKETLKDKVAQGFVLREDQITVNFNYRGEVDGMYEVRASIKANLLPQVNPDEITSKIYGKYPDIAEDYLTSIDGFSKAEIVLKPRFPGKLGTLPRVKKNITVEVAAQK